MNFEIRADGIHFDGYVNVTGKMSKPVITPNRQRVVETIEERAFQTALSQTSNVEVWLDHNPNRVIAQTKDGTVELREDQIGLRATGVITDPEVVQDAKRLRGWSFGFIKPKSRMEQRADGLPRRILEEFELIEVSIIDKTKLPCYVGTSIEARADGETLELRSFDCEVVTVDDTPEERAEDDQAKETVVNENYKYENRLRAIQAGL